jgi:Flp pilus assembly protein TadD
MNKIKVSLLLMVVVLAGLKINAQSIDEGKKFMYYEKWRSAKSTFEKLLATNPANADAAYNLGLIYLKADDFLNVGTAKEIFRKGLEAAANSPLLIAGMGHVELLEGKTQDARNRFETAISLSQGKSIPVFNAIGLANGDYDSKNGDPTYAIEKLKQATMVKGFKDPETYCLLGDAYRKLIDGGSAITAYQNALNISPNYARASYRSGKVYQTQGATQNDVFMKYYNEAIAKDANYGPVYNNLFNYYYNFDINKAGGYLDTYLNIMGADEPKGCYYRASVKYAQALNKESITKANECIAEAKAAGQEPYSKLYGLIGYAYDKLGDSVNAKSAFETFFAKAKSTDIGPTDKTTYANILLKFPGNEETAGKLVDEAVALDTVETSKVASLKGMAQRFETAKNFAAAAEWYKKILNTKRNPSKTDIYNVASNYSRSTNYAASIEHYNIYTAKYPTETFGHYMIGVTQNKIDTMPVQQGLANPAFMKVIELGEAQWATDSAKVKTHLLNAYQHFIQFAANTQKDKKVASDYCGKFLAKDPTNAEVANFKKMFDNPATKLGPTQKQPATGAKPATKPATGATKPTTGSKPSATPKKK